MMEPVGHIDFYINGGVSPQPGCDCTLWETINGKCDSYFSCSHSRAPPLIIDSYRPNQCQLVGYECPSGYDAFNEVIPIPYFLIGLVTNFIRWL